MLRFIKHHMETIDGIEIYPLFSLTLFFLFFVGLFIYVMRGRKNRFEEISMYPLSDDVNADLQSNQDLDNSKDK